MKSPTAMATARKTSSSSTLKMIRNEGDNVNKESCKDKGFETSPNERGYCGGSANPLRCSTAKNGKSHTSESNSATDKDNAVCSGECQDSCGSNEQKRSTIDKTDNECANADKATGCCVAKKDVCDASGGKNDCCAPTAIFTAAEKVSCCGSGQGGNGLESQGQCCGPKNTGCSIATAGGCGGEKVCKPVAPHLKSCGDEKPSGIRLPSPAADCGQGGCSAAACCSGSRSGVEVTSSPKYDEKMKPAHIDIEKGSAVEHVVLDVQGLTCTGCETKLSRSLQVIPGISNLRTSLLLSQAEFDLSEKAAPVLEVIKAVEKSTGFACQRLDTQRQEVDVDVNDARTFVELKYPEGVTEMTDIDKRTVRIRFDGRVIGARALVENGFNDCLILAAPRGSSELEGGKRHVWRTGWITLLSAVLTIPVLVLAWASLRPRPIVYNSISLVLATIVQVIIAGPFYLSALRALFFTHVIEVDLLIVLSTSAAYIFSVVSFGYQVADRPLPTGEFFETSTLLVTLIMLGRWVSAFARQRAAESVSIRSLQETKAVVCDADGRGDREVDARLLQYGDFFKITPDSRIPTDGTVVSGVTEVDESMVTGESLPVEKSPGSTVIAGSLNASGVVVVRLTHLPGNNTISRIAAMVDEAKFSKPKTHELVNIVASYFVPVILTLTIITFAIWIAIGISIRHQNGGHSAVNAITYAISVLIVSCPCGIGLAVPMVIVIAGGVAAKHGVIFKSAISIEIAHKASHVVFDKTGTLTEGQLSVVEAIYLSDEEDLAGSITLGLTSSSKHPVSVAISTHLTAKGINAIKIQESRSVTGKGMEGIFEGSTVRCGNTRWLLAETLPEVQSLLAQGLTVFGVAKNDHPIAVFGLSDSLRPESYLVITELHKRNIPVSIVSGDDAGAVEAVAAKLGIPANRVRSRCTPGEKQVYLKNLMKDEKHVVMFCGDGTNDAVALTQANVGVHVNTGSEVAQTAADVVLVRPHLTRLLVVLDLSKAATTRILFNFAWSFIYNLFAILLAAGAFVNARIPPQYAGLGEIVSVVPVVLIALHLRWFRREY